MVELIYKSGMGEVRRGNEIRDISSYLEGVNSKKISFEYLSNLEKQDINGVCLENIYTYDGIPLYIFCRNSICITVEEIVICTIILKKINEEFEDDISVKTDSDIMFDLCSDIFNMKCEKIKTENNSLKINKFKFLRRIAKGYYAYLKYKMKKKKKENILIFSHVVAINKLTRNGKEYYYDTQLGGITDGLKNEYNIMNFQLLSSVSLIDKALKYKDDVIPYELFIAYKRQIKDKLIDESLIEDNTKAIHCMDFNFENIDLKNIVIKHAFADFKFQCLSYLKEILAMKKLIKKDKIKKCIVIGEGDRGRCIITAGNMCGIKTYALQHGTISETSSAYIYNLKRSFPIVPSRTFVWGEKYKSLLINHNNMYNENNVIVSGQPRTDLLFKDNYHTKSDIHEEIRILYATQATSYMEDLVYPPTEMLFKSISNLNKKYELIIKLHPGDFHVSDYEKMIKKYEIRNVKIVRESDLYDLIKWSDVIITVHSTVAVEGAIFNKPSVCILLSKYDDVAEFVKDGVSMGARNEDELRNILLNIKDNHNNEKMQQYLKYNFYKIDGNVNQRILNIIK